MVEAFMLRALQLAQLGQGAVSPNPLVGCVIVFEDLIIGEGYHHACGQAHAEVNALASVKDKSKLHQSTLYVTLEPCNHFGKTPPCTEKIISNSIPKVVICNLDPNPLVSGKGIQRLKEAGIEVVLGVCEEEGRLLNKRFFTFQEKNRPYVMLKWAQTSEGFLARDNYDSKWISSKLSRKWVHQWRTEEDAIMVGYRTVLVDNPQLTARAWPGKNPVRVVFDKYLDLFRGEQAYHVLDKTVKTVIINFLENKESDNLLCIKIDPTQNHAQQIIEKLYQLNIQSLMVEGGSILLQQFIKENLWDEARIFTAPIVFHKGIEAPNLKRVPADSFEIDHDRLDIYLNR